MAEETTLCTMGGTPMTEQEYLDSIECSVGQTPIADAGVLCADGGAPEMPTYQGLICSAGGEPEIPAEFLCHDGAQPGGNSRYCSDGVSPFQERSDQCNVGNYVAEVIAPDEPGGIDCRYGISFHTGVCESGGAVRPTDAGYLDCDFGGTFRASYECALGSFPTEPLSEAVCFQGSRPSADPSQGGGVRSGSQAETMLDQMTDIINQSWLAIDAARRAFIGHSTQHGFRENTGLFAWLENAIRYYMALHYYEVGEWVLTDLGEQAIQEELRRKIAQFLSAESGARRELIANMNTAITPFWSNWAEILFGYSADGWARRIGNIGGANYLSADTAGQGMYGRIIGRLGPLSPEAGWCVPGAGGNENPAGISPGEAYCYVGSSHGTWRSSLDCITGTRYGEW